MNRRWWPWAAIAGILAAVAAIQYAMGRVPICTCGYVRLWHGDVWSSGNSQHLTDWYTLSHLAHGFIFYALLRWLRPGWSVAWRAVAAMLIEGGWEVVENTPLIIDRYREVTASLDYYGDSIVNSFGDGVAMLVGFFLAARLPVVLSVVIVIGMEALAGWMIRDNLALNVVMLVWPLDAVREWQMQGAPSTR
ncbi:DUF2585 domain-containing protein [Roseomonas terrae]|uniref:DUF2585 domain-containing protein n=1 Tax=Neoroseomonas terrae TaxID=424799 RepID=A0ABS5EBM5_9PROT|nr:DUF2585 domain-containing protein [Neoroseomonas terrae]MBR0648418.1 DUF2585 domain-containing protein [Neoroseomonas terrae]